MVCEFHDSAARNIWPALLDLRQFLLAAKARTSTTASLLGNEDGWRFTHEPARRVAPGELRIALALSEEEEDRLEPGPDLEVFSYRAFLDGDDPLIRAGEDRAALDPVRTLLRIYLPCLLGGFRARQQGKLFLIAHLAQTLDGRIACKNGHSQWISNQANLRHAHRLRALHDAVMIGARAVELDDPQLTVRHVEGKNPRRVVLNASGSVLHRASEFQVCQGDGSLFLCQEQAPEMPCLNGTNEVVRLPGSGRLCDTDALARALAERGLHSVFLEGGGQTISHFLHTGAIDVLHLHVAPRILGSGISSFALPEVMDIDSAHHLHMEHFSMDGEMLFECRRRRLAPEQ